MFGMGFGEMAVIALLGILIFGNRLPQTMRSMGKGVTEFKRGLKEMDDDVNKAVEAGLKREGDGR
jgi:sec-independent protein translocase protein TatA